MLLRISAEIVSPSGEPVAHLFGGDDIPNGWVAKAFPDRPSNITAAVQFYKGVGTALRGALLVGRYSKAATAAEADVLNSLATDQLDKLLPVTTSDAATASSPKIFKDQVDALIGKTQ